MRRPHVRARPTPGTMNKLERRYESHLELRRIGGEVREYRFESVKLKLAPSTFYTPDFLVILADGSVELHEVKGYWEDDARAKTKVAAAILPFPIVGVTFERGAWVYEEFPMA